MGKKKNKKQKQQQQSKETKKSPPIVTETSEEEIEQEETERKEPEQATQQDTSDSDSSHEEQIAELPPPTEEQSQEPKKLPNTVEKKGDFAFGLIMGLIIVFVIALLVFLLELDYASKLEKKIDKLEAAIANLDVQTVQKRLVSLEETRNSLVQQNDQLRVKFGNLQARLNEVEKQANIQPTEVKPNENSTQPNVPSTPTQVTPPTPTTPEVKSSENPTPNTPTPNASTTPPAKSSVEIELIDATWTPKMNVAIIITNKTTGEQFTAATNEAGKVFWKDISHGEYNVKAEFDGVKGKRLLQEEFTVGPGKFANVVLREME